VTAVEASRTPTFVGGFARSPRCESIVRCPAPVATSSGFAGPWSRAGESPTTASPFTSPGTEDTRELLSKLDTLVLPRTVATFPRTNFSRPVAQGISSRSTRASELLFNKGAPLASIFHRMVAAEVAGSSAAVRV